MSKIAAAAGASPRGDRLIAVRYSGRQWFEPRLRGFTRLDCSATSKIADSLMTQCFPKHRVLWDRDPDCLPAGEFVQAVPEPYGEISTTSSNVSWPGKKPLEEARWSVTLFLLS